jgi:hypothetical protein
MRAGQNQNIDDDTRARARRFAADADMPKPAVEGRSRAAKAPVVTKKMLADSGHDNLRDYMNAQRGLTRRGMSKAAAEKQLGLGEKPSAESVKAAEARLGLKGSSGLDADAKDRNYVRRDMKDRMETIDRETQGDFLRAMKDKPRRTPEPLTSTRKPGTNVNYENTEGMKRGGAVRGWGAARGARKAKVY